MKVHTVYIGLGSNMGDRVAFLREAVQRLGAIVTIEKASRLYVAAPLGYVRDDAFVNAVVSGSTSLKPLELLEMMQAIEQTMGRRPGVTFGPLTQSSPSSPTGTRWSQSTCRTSIASTSCAPAH
mgnify:CR=1 FL=1